MDKSFTNKVQDQTYANESISSGSRSQNGLVSAAEPLDVNRTTVATAQANAPPSFQNGNLQATVNTSTVIPPAMEIPVSPQAHTCEKYRAECHERDGFIVSVVVVIICVFIYGFTGHTWQFQALPCSTCILYVLYKKYCDDRRRYAAYGRHRLEGHTRTAISVNNDGGNSIGRHSIGGLSIENHSIGGLSMENHSTRNHSFGNHSTGHHSFGHHSFGGGGWSGGS